MGDLMLVFFAVATILAMAHGIPIQPEAPAMHRPYQFGYKVPNNQHRHETKDANGIIKGEFGFLTGDGTYHVAQYETDEFGHYRLISSRSIYRFNPDAPVSKPNPTTSTTDAPSSRSPKSFGSSADALNQRHLNSIELVSSKPSLKQDKTEHSLGLSGNSFARNAQAPVTKQQAKPINKNYAPSSPKATTKPYSSDGKSGPAATHRTSSPTPTTPPKIIQIPTEGNYFIHIPANARTSLGTTGDLLYVFNYATTFNGHHEMGYRDGAKEGAYFTVNRDKVRRTVRYKLSSTNEVIARVMEYDVVADEDTPTDASDKTGVLTRNEFKWH